MESLKSLGLTNKTSSCEVSALRVNKTVQHNTGIVLGGFKDYYSNLAGNLLKKLPKRPNKFALNKKALFRVLKRHYLACVSEKTILTSFKIPTYLKQLVWTIYLFVFKGWYKSLSSTYH